MQVLIIEDEQKMADLLKRGLEEEGMRVEIAGDGDTGLKAGKEGKFDVILLDVTLPGMDGFAVARALREALVKTPILMLTARDSTEMKVKGLDSGADDYVTKPFCFFRIACPYQSFTASFRRRNEITNWRFSFRFNLSSRNAQWRRSSIDRQRI